MGRILPADDPAAVLEATHVLDAGGLVVLPTGGTYVVAGDALVDEAVDRVHAVKARATPQALPVLVADLGDARHVAHVTPLARRLAARFLPGPLTLVLPARPTVPDNLLAGRDTVAVRLADGPLAEGLAGHFGPLTAPGAQPAGVPPVTTVQEAQGGLGDAVALYVDGGPLAGLRPTVVDATGEVGRVLREGPIGESDLQRADELS